MNSNQNIDALLENKDVQPLVLLSDWVASVSEFQDILKRNKDEHIEILLVTSYPPRECGIATYSQDLVNALKSTFGKSVSVKICALEAEDERHEYGREVKFIFDTSSSDRYVELASEINKSNDIKMVLVQHEFGFFKDHESDFESFLNAIMKPVVIAFHTVLPGPDNLLKMRVQGIIAASDSVIVMTHHSSNILQVDYDLEAEKITVIPHGTHLVAYANRGALKKKYGLSKRHILSTFGLISAGKGIETTLNALPEIIKTSPDVLFLIIGKTHPSVVKQEAEQYREKLEAIISELQIQDYVKFINRYLPLPELLEYLQLTDIYLFTSLDPNQAVSGTFAYAVSCGCPIISTPIPHALEILNNDGGIIVDFGNSSQLAEKINQLLWDKEMRKNLSLNGLHRMASTAWVNIAISHLMLIKKVLGSHLLVEYSLPPINLDHLKRMTTDFGIIQFAKINHPDISSGYTLDDNARALIAICMHYELKRDYKDIEYMRLYLDFIKNCQLENGQFMNYVNELGKFSDQNRTGNLEDPNGRAIWALGYLISMGDQLPESFDSIITDAEAIMNSALLNIHKIHSTRALAFVIKGIYYLNKKNESADHLPLVKELTNRLVQMYKHESGDEWHWFESYLTYANSVLPEAMLCAWLLTGNAIYKEIALSSFEFLLSKTFFQNRIKVISNKTWLIKADKSHVYQKEILGGEQPIDVAYSIITLSKFYDVFRDLSYKNKMQTAFSWFLGNNPLNQTIYNSFTGGCYDGLEENNVNLNQGAESTLSYLMARITMDPHHKTLAKRELKLRRRMERVVHE